MEQLSRVIPPVPDVFGHPGSLNQKKSDPLPKQKDTHSKLQNMRVYVYIYTYVLYL